MKRNKFATKGGKSSKKKVARRRGRYTPNASMLPAPNGTSVLLAHVERITGGSFANVMCEDSVRRRGKFAGRLRKRVFIRSGDVVLILRRLNMRDKVCDIIHKYSETEKVAMQAEGKLEFCGKNYQFDSELFEDAAPVARIRDDTLDLPPICESDTDSDADADADSDAEVDVDVDSDD